MAKRKIFGETRKLINEGLDLGWTPKAIVDFLKEKADCEISSTAIIKYRRKRVKALDLRDARKASKDYRGPVINELRRTRHRLEKILKDAEKEIAPATPTDVDKLRRRIIDLYQAEIDALKAKGKEEETDITLLFKKEAERQPDESKRDYRGVVLGMLRGSKREKGSPLPLPEENSEGSLAEEDSQ